MVFTTLGERFYKSARERKTKTRRDAGATKTVSDIARGRDVIALVAEIPAALQRAQVA